MSAPTVESIIDQIRRLPDTERLVLEQCLADLSEAEWKREAENARQTSREKGIDQAAIDRAIHDHRYGS